MWLENSEGFLLEVTKGTFIKEDRKRQSMKQRGSEEAGLAFSGSQSSSTVSNTWAIQSALVSLAALPTHVVTAFTFFFCCEFSININLLAYYSIKAFRVSSAECLQCSLRPAKLHKGHIDHHINHTEPLR